MTKCRIPGCPHKDLSVKGQYPKINFFGFPHAKDSERRKKWINACGGMEKIVNLDHGKYYDKFTYYFIKLIFTNISDKICAVHFDDDAFKITKPMTNPLFRKANLDFRVRVTDVAVPTLNLPNFKEVKRLYYSNTCILYACLRKFFSIDIIAF